MKRKHGFGHVWGLCLFFALALALLPGSVSRADKEEPLIPDNGIPIVYLNIDESRGTIEDMLSSPKHEVYCYGKVSIDVPEGFRYCDFPDQECVSLNNLDMSIRGRGNSSWGQRNKKPFKIKLDKKTDIFGLGKNKHWVLIANVADESLLRDRITGWLGDEMGFEFTPRGVPVDLVMRGPIYGTKYLGSYYLSENVRVDENRLEIDELEETDTDPLVITGGYLVQNSAQVEETSKDRFFTSRGANWATHTPSFDTESDNLFSSAEDEQEDPLFARDLADAYENHVQQEYIQNYVQKFEDVLYSEGTAYRDLMDVESAAKYWLIQEIPLNGDAFATGSTYFYKKRDTQSEVGKIFWGPVWDFDYAWTYRPYTFGFEYGHEWMKPMFYDTAEGGFVDELHKQWPVMKAALEELIRSGGLIDQYYEETRASAEADHKVNSPDSPFDYHAETEKLKKWIRDRITWVDENFEQLDHMVHKMTFVVEGKPDMIDYFGENESVAIGDIVPEREGYTFIGWEDEGGQIVESEVVADQDHMYKARFLPDSEVTHGQYIALATESDVIVYNNYFRTYKINYKVVPEDAFDQGVVWSSSDERLASVDRFGNVRYTGTGEVTFTAKLKLGETREFKLLITKEEFPPMTSVELEEDALELAQGETAVLRYRTAPSPAKVNQVVYESENDNVVTADEFGVLTAKGPGEAKVRVIIHAPSEGGEDVELETYATVTVTGGESETESRTEAESESRDAAESTPVESPLGSGKTSKDNTMMWMILALVLILIPVVYRSVTNKRR